MNRKSEIEWFKPSEKMPSLFFNDDILFVSFADGEEMIYNGYYDTIASVFVGYCDDCPDEYNLDEVSYWAYMPEPPKEETP